MKFLLKSELLLMRYRLPLILLLSLSISGCAINHPDNTNPQDPYEHINRKVFAFNMAVDKAVIRPVAKTYDLILPSPAKKGVSNFFSNLDDLTVTANNLLQLQFKKAVANLARVVINTIVGVGGLFDVATPMGIPKSIGDFGLTLAAWGSDNTPYLVLPFFGALTIRDAVGIPVDYLLFSVWPHVDSYALRYGLEGEDIIQARATFLASDRVLEQTFDPYVFMRDAYLQRREFLINKTKKPETETKTEENRLAYPIPIDRKIIAH